MSALPIVSAELPDEDFLDEVTQLVRHWLTVASDLPIDRAARLLADVLEDQAGLDFTVGFVDSVIRPESPRVSARAFSELARDVPAFLPWYLRQAVRLGGFAGRFAPRLVIPVVRRVLRQLVAHLVVDATDARLGKSIATIRRQGFRPNVNLLGEAVLGEREAARRLEGARELLARGDVDYVSIKVSATVAPHSPWAFDEAVDHVVESLLPLFTQAAQFSPGKFINLDMEEYRDLDLTVAVFCALLDRQELEHLEAGIVLQAYLPDALAAMERLQDWAAARRSRGGAGIKVRLVKGANLPMERVEATVHGWPLATWRTKQDSDTHYKRVLDFALTPERTENVRLGVAGHNLFDIAYAWTLAGRRGVRKGIEFEMLLGMAQGQAEAVRQTVGGLLVYTPVVRPKEFDVAIAYLIRRLEEGASQDNFMSAVFNLHDNEALFTREENRFRASLTGLTEAEPVTSFRTQDRSNDEPIFETEFANRPDTDPSIAANRAWGYDIISRVESSEIGLALVDETTVTESSELESVLSRVHASTWGSRTGAQRAAVLREAAVALERRRPELIEVMASECGKTIDQGDPEVSEAIDFANYYATLAEDLDTVDGATHIPVQLTLVTPPWNFPVAIPAGSVLAALAAGSAVVVKPASQARRCGAVLAEVLWSAGVPADALTLLNVDEGELGKQLIADPRVDRLILTGAYETAELFRSFRADLPLLAETSGKNALVITESADIDLAVKDLVNSAFGHAGQKCSAASLAIVVGSVATSRRFREQLADAVSSLTVGYPTDPTVQVGPVIEPATGKLLRALTELEPGQQWLVEPCQLDESGRLWSPGVKTGVRPGSAFHLTEYFGPVLGIMAADSLDQALTWQNAVDYGLTAGIHSLDAAEIEVWLRHIEAGNVYVNRGITGAIVRRQPFGGWKKSAVGAGTKAGGPNYLVGLSDWQTARATSTAELSPRTRTVLAGARELGLATSGLERALRSDAAAWAEEFGITRDVTDLQVERNIMRYVPDQATIRWSAGVTVEQLLRVVAVALVAKAQVFVSTADPIDAPVSKLLGRLGVPHAHQPADQWHESLRNRAAGRIRVLGGDRQELAEFSQGRPDLAIYDQPVTESGRIEMLPFLREQAISATAHRFGTPHGLGDAISNFAKVR